MFKKKSFISFIALFLISVLLLPAQFMAAQTAQKTITIIHTNDIHSRVEEKPGMGFAKIASKINELRNTMGKENVLVLDAGDTLHGLPMATVSTGEAIVKILNAIQYDAMTPGNHDFNYGQARLTELSAQMDFPLLCANVKKADGTTLFKPYMIKEVNGIKIGIFGLSTPETTYKTHPKNVEGLVFEDPSTAAKAMVAELKGEVDLIIALAHLGVDESSTYTSEKVALEVDGIDVIIDGHSHTTFPEGQRVKDTLIVQAGEYANAIGILTITIDKDQKISLSPSLYTKEEALDATPDEKLTALIIDLKTEFDALTNEKVGSTPIKLEGARDFVRTGETNMGNLIVNAMLEVTGADVALTNGGGIRASIEAGAITKKDIITVLPFGNYITTLDVTGQELLDALEVGTAGYPEAAGCFPHIGGMTFTLDPSKPFGSRVSHVKIGKEALDLAATYSLATNDFIAAGGDGYTMFSDNPITGEYPGLDEAVIGYINTFGVENSAVIDKVTVVMPSVIDPIASIETNIEVKEGFITYIIQYGDTLSKLAQKAGTTYQELAQLNNITNPHLILVGNTLLLPTS